ncbi:MAG: hypothetical protein JWQ16_2001 [Novosphingobium sp.]|nr:hypothetical protein [Novosphingobium sp.]
MRRFGKLAFASASLLAFAAPAYAQDTATGADEGAAAGNAGDIVVTARRSEERLQDVPISITVFNQEQLNNRNVTSGGDLATYTPSLSVNNRFGGDTATFAIRGFVQEGQTSPSVAVYFADVVAPRAQGGTAGGNGAGPGAFFDLQNVQVLKGPQGTLFGRNTTGGAILLVPQKPTSSLEGYVEGSLGSYDLRRIQGAINVPLSDTFRVRLGFDRQKRRGYLNNVSGVGPKDLNDIDYWAARLSVVGELTPNLENYTIFSISESKTNGGLAKIDAITAPGGAIPSRDICTNVQIQTFFSAACPTNIRQAQINATSGNYYDVSNGNPDPFLRIRQWQAINTTTWQTSDLVTIKNIASYAEFRQAQSSNIYGENPYQSGATLPFYFINLVPAPGYDNISQSTFTEELQIQGRTADDKFNYQAGVYYENSQPLGFQKTLSASSIACTNVAGLQCQDILTAATAGAANGSVQESASKYSFRNLGIYAQATFAITDQLSLTGGIRYTSDKVTGVGQSRRYRFSPGAIGAPTGAECAQPNTVVQGGTLAQVLADPSRCTFTLTQQSSRPTWLIDLDYKPTDDVLVYAKYSRGYRQGGINVSSYGLETWGPEKVDVYEVGAKTSFGGSLRGTFNIAAFYNDFKEQQIAVNTISCVNFFNPAICTGVPSVSSAQGIGGGGASSIKGIEVDASISPFEGFRVDVGYSYIKTRITRNPDTSVIPVGFSLLQPNSGGIGGPLALTPEHKLAATASYTLPLDQSIGRVTLSGTFTYQSDQFGNASSLPSRQTLPSQHNVNLNLNWYDIAGQPVDLSLFVTNLTKQKFVTYTTGSSFGPEAVNLNEPRMFGARLKVRLGN